MILNSPTISGSLTVTGNIIASGSITLSGSVASASYASTASFVALAQSASNAVAAQTASFANAFTVAGNLTAQTLVVQTITSSVDFVTGSTRFGSSLSTSTHQFTGSVSITGSLDVITNGTEFQVNSTGVNLGNALTDSHIISGSLRVNPNGLFVSGSGLVGIGTTSPEGVLTIQGTSAQPSTSGTIANSLLQLVGSLNNQLNIGSNTVAGDYGSYIQSSDNNLAVPYPLNLQPNGGNVGIGTSTPSQKLEVVGGEIKAGRIDSSNEGGQVSFGRSTDNATAWYIDAYGNVASPQLRFVNVTNAVVAMTITGSNVGIGTSSPAELLDVNGAIKINNYITTRTSGYTSYNLNAYYDGSNWRKGASGYARRIQMGSDNGGSLQYSVSSAGGSANDVITWSDKVVINDTGDVFIGTNDPNATNNGIALLQNGEIDISRSSGTSGIFNRNTTNGQILDFRYNNTQVGSISTNSNSLPSDLNFKKDISNISLGLNFVSKLRPVHYRHKMDEDNEPLSNGIIAQEMEEALSECGIEKNSLLILQHKPNEKENESQYWVDYTKMIPVLIKSIQELKATNDDLQSQINELKAQ
jgi:hypothetical protein